MPFLLVQYRFQSSISGDAQTEFVPECILQDNEEDGKWRFFSIVEDRSILRTYIYKYALDIKQNIYDSRDSLFRINSYLCKSDYTFGLCGLFSNISLVSLSHVLNTGAGTSVKSLSTTGLFRFFLSDLTLLY